MPGVFIGDRRAACDICGTAVNPVVTLVGAQPTYDGVTACVQCLARAVDLVCGWRFESQVMHALSVSDVAARFRNPGAARSSHPNGKEIRRRKNP